MQPFRSIKRFFKNKYWALFELITLKLMNSANRMLRKIILHKGKDPNYVAPPPPPPPVLSPARPYVSFGGGSDSSYVRNPASNPVLVSRAKLKAAAELVQKKKLEAQLALQAITEPEVVEELPPVEVQEELQVTTDSI